MKQISLKLAFMALCWMMGMSAMAQTTVTINKLNYQLNGTEACVSGHMYPTDVVIPATIESDGLTYRVTSIGNYAFDNCTSLTSVTIPNSVTSIGEYAFSGCSSLTSMNIPSSVTSISQSAFKKCSSLTSIVVDSGNSVYDSRNNCNAIIKTSTNELVIGCKNTIIPTSVTSIGSYAFSECTDFTSIEIPKSVTSIGSYAFGYTDITSVTIPSSVTSIGAGVFSCCFDLTSVTIPNSVTCIGDSAFYGSYRITSVNIPSSITSIGRRVFGDCSDLTSIDIPNSVTSIGDYAFYNCSGLTSVTIGNSVTSIGEYAFSNCTRLASVTIPNSVTSIGDHAFYFCSSLTSVTIPDSVTYVGMFAFTQCPWLNNLPDGLIYIGCVAYFYKGMMPDNTSITIKEGTVTIDMNAFYNQRGLTSVTIPNSVKTISAWAFSNCSGLTSVTIPNSVDVIAIDAFNGCSSLTSVTVEWNIPISITNTRPFSNRTNATLYVPKGCKSAYESADYWKDFKEIVEVGGLEEQDMSLNELPTMTFGDIAYELPASTTEGLTLAWAIEDETIAEISGNTLTIKGAGTTTVTATQGGNDEYEAFERTFTLTVNKAPLTITANDCTKQEGEENPDLTVSYEGFVYDDDASSLTTQPTITTTATTESPAGTYPITASGAEAANYEITYVEGTLTVTEAPVLSSSSLYVAETTVLCGSQETLPIVFESEVAYGGLQCELTLPEGITLSKVTKTERLTDDFILQKNQTGDNTYQILLYNTSRLSFAGNDGALFTLTVDVDDEMAVGDYTLMLKDIVVSTIDEQQEDLPDFSGTIHVEDYMIGDANRDNRVNVTDIMAIANYILQIPGSNFNKKAADLNGDNRVNVTDIMGVANIILRVNTTQNAPWNGQMLDPQ